MVSIPTDLAARLSELFANEPAKLDGARARLRALGAKGLRRLSHEITTVKESMGRLKAEERSSEIRKTVEAYLSDPSLLGDEEDAAPDHDRPWPAKHDPPAPEENPEADAAGEAIEPERPDGFDRCRGILSEKPAVGDSLGTIQRQAVVRGLHELALLAGKVKPTDSPSPDLIKKVDRITSSRRTINVQAVVELIQEDLNITVDNKTVATVLDILRTKYNPEHVAGRRFHRVLKVGSARKPNKPKPEPSP